MWMHVYRLVLYVRLSQDLNVVNRKSRTLFFRRTREIRLGHILIFTKIGYHHFKNSHR